MYARVLIEMIVTQEFHDAIYFENKYGELVTPAVEYEWKPIRGSKCSQIGHMGENYRVGSRYEWRPKIVDSEGFQTIAYMKPKGGAQGITTLYLATPTTHNTLVGLSDLLPVNKDFRILEDIEEECIENPSDGHTGLDYADSPTPKPIVDSDTALGPSKIQPLRSCVISYGLEDIMFRGRFFTWNNKQSRAKKVFSKIKQVFGNTLWLDSYPQVKPFFFLKESSIIRQYSCNSFLLLMVRDLFDSLIIGLIILTLLKWCVRVGLYKFQATAAILYQGSSKLLKSHLKKKFQEPLQLTLHKAEKDFLFAQEQLNLKPDNPDLATLKREATVKFR